MYKMISDRRSIDVQPIPWGDKTPINIPDGALGRRSLKMSESCENMQLQGIDVSIPLLEKSNSYTRWEIPSTGGYLTDWPEGDSIDWIKEYQLLTWYDSGEYCEHVVETIGIPRIAPELIHDTHENTPGIKHLQSPIVQASLFCERLIEKHVHIAHQAIDDLPPLDSWDWESQYRDSFIRPFDTVLKQWHKSVEQDEPRMALIVKIAQCLSDLVTSLCESPRVVLKHTRRLQQVNRVQQIDSTCLRWLARQSGLTISEKAGPKQEVMSLARIENADTLENRVLKDFLKRALKAGKAYIVEHQKFQTHIRCITVRKFIRKISQALRSTQLAHVPSLFGVPEPNYVLQYDRRYSEMWDWYLKLVRHDRVIDSVWRWRQRTWAEEVRLACLAALKVENSNDLPRTDSLIYSEQINGQFISPESGTQTIIINDKRADIIAGQSFMTQHQLLHSRVKSACPDLAVTTHIKYPQTLAIWGILDFGMTQYLHGILDSLKSVAGKDTSVIIAVPSFEGINICVHDNINILKLPLDSSAHELRRILLSRLHCHKQNEAPLQ